MKPISMIQDLATRPIVVDARHADSVSRKAASLFTRLVPRHREDRREDEPTPIRNADTLSLDQERPS